MASSSAPLTSTRHMPIAASGATADLTQTVCSAPFAGTVSAVRYYAKAAITGAASPASRTFTLYNRGQTDGTGTTVAAQKAMVGGVNAVAKTACAITLSGTPANLAVAAGDVLDFESLHIGGTGLADPGGHLEVEFTRSQAE